MKFPNQKIVQQIRERFPSGCRVELIHMNDPYVNLESG